MARYMDYVNCHVAVGSSGPLLTLLGWVAGLGEVPQANG